MARRHQLQYGDTDSQPEQSQAKDMAATPASVAVAPFVPLFQEPKRAALKPPAVKHRNGSSKRLRDTNPEEWEARRAARQKKKAAEQAARAKAKADAKEAAAKRAEDEARQEAAAEAELAAARLANANFRQRPPKERHALTDEEIVAHEAERAILQKAEDEAERALHNMRADRMRASIERREFLIGAMLNELDYSTDVQTDKINTSRTILARMRADHAAQHAHSSEPMGMDERQQHNFRAEMLRARVAAHEARITALEAAPHAGHADQQRDIRIEKGKLALASRTLAEHNAFSIQADRLLQEHTSKPLRELSALESARDRSRAEQGRAITLQQEKLAESKRELAEHICDDVRQERMVRQLTKKIEAQVARIEEIATKDPKNKKQHAKATAQLSIMRRQLSHLVAQSRSDAPDAPVEVAPRTRTVEAKPKETKRDRLWREATDSRAEAEAARAKAVTAKAAYDAAKAAYDNAQAEGKTDGKPPELIYRHLERRASQLEQTAALKAERYRKEDDRSKEPAARKSSDRPKPAKKKTASATIPESAEAPKPTTDKPVVLTPKAPAPAAALDDTNAAKPARKARVRYPKKAPVPVRKLSLEELAAIEAKALAKARAKDEVPSKMVTKASSGVPTDAPAETHAVVTQNATAVANDLPQQILAILRRGSDATGEVAPAPAPAKRPRAAAAKRVKKTAAAAPEPAPDMAAAGHSERTAPTEPVTEISDALVAQRAAEVAKRFLSIQPVSLTPTPQDLLDDARQRAKDAIASGAPDAFQLIREAARLERELIEAGITVDPKTKVAPDVPASAPVAPPAAPSFVARLEARGERAGVSPATTGKSWEAQEAARLAQRAKDDAVKAATIAQLQADGVISAKKSRAR